MVEHLRNDDGDNHGGKGDGNHNSIIVVVICFIWFDYTAEHNATKDNTQHM
jgi:hypothetical protein